MEKYKDILKFEIKDKRTNIITVNILFNKVVIGKILCNTYTDEITIHAFKKELDPQPVITKFQLEKLDEIDFNMAVGNYLTSGKLDLTKSKDRMVANIISNNFVAINKILLEDDFFIEFNRGLITREYRIGKEVVAMKCMFNNIDIVAVFYEEKTNSLAICSHYSNDDSLDPIVTDFELKRGML